jgi:N-acetyl-anhydromuramyl-L-alanine amidase AmpD/V8-like Glu-specific endopeptidase
MRPQIIPTRFEATSRFPGVRFTIRTESTPQRAEIAIGTEPTLFRAEGKARRTLNNFYSSRGQGPLTILGGEGVYVVPPDVLARFAGQARLYYGLATGPAGNGDALQVAVMPSEMSPYLSLQGLSARNLLRVRMPRSRVNGSAGYGADARSSLEWAGDAANGAWPVGANGKPGATTQPARPVDGAPYDDGFGPMPVASPSPPPPAAAPAAGSVTPGSAAPSNGATAAASAWAPRTARAYGRARGLSTDIPDDRGIEGGVYTPDHEAVVTESAASFGRGLALTTAEYPGTSRVAPATAFRAMAQPRTIQRLVIHITDGPTTRSAVNTFISPAARVSAHYLVGQDGEVVQFVAENDIAWHANGANSDSIGIEHVAIQRGGVTYGSTHFPEMFPTDVQYEASAALVSYLCDKYGIPADRAHVLGHAEADTRTTHTSCPSGANWDWDYFMTMVQNRISVPHTQGLQGDGIRRVAAARSTGLALSTGTDPFTVDVKYRFFIPSPIIDAPTAVFGGDGRSFSYEEGTSRGEIHARYQLPRGGGRPTLTVLDRRWGESIEYVYNDTVHPSGKPDWWREKRQDKFVALIDRATLAVSDSNLRIWEGTESTALYEEAVREQAWLLALHADGSLPLSAQAPAINSDLTLLLRLKDGAVQARLSGEHDGFPAHECYVNGRLFYAWDPVAEGTSPMSLAPPMDVEVDTDWATIATVSAAQGLGLPRGPRPSTALAVASRGLARVTQVYAPTDPASAAAALADFMRRDASWAAGVDNTGFFPHSAICHLEMTDSAGSVYYGTGFYVAQDLILSVAHNFTDMTSVRVRAGRNGSGFCLSDFTVTPSDWTVHPLYVPGNSDFDLAVVRTSTPPPGGRAFDVLEALNVSQPSPIIVCGYGAETVDPLKQHLDGDAVRELSPSGEIMRYNLQTEKGNSGSPVFYLFGYEDHERRMSVQDYSLVAVHSASHDVQYNQACALSSSKIEWIHGRGLVSVAQALAHVRTRAAGRSLDVEAPAIAAVSWDDVALIVQPTGASGWAAAAAMVIGWRDRMPLVPDALAELHRKLSVMTGALDAGSVASFGAAAGLMAEPAQPFTPAGFRSLLERNGPLWVGSLDQDMHAIVVTGIFQTDGQVYVRIADPWDRVVSASGASTGYAATPVTGSRYVIRWDDLVAEYGQGAAGQPGGLAVLHGGGRSETRSSVSVVTVPPAGEGLGYARANGVIAARSQQQAHRPSQHYAG